MNKNIPAGVKTIAIINFIISGWYFYTFFISFGVNFLIIGIFLALIGVHLWKGKKWAKFSELFISFIGIFIGIIFILGSVLVLNMKILPENITSSGIYLYLIFGTLSFALWAIIGIYLLTNRMAKRYLNN